MKKDWFSEFKEITAEERAILDGGAGVDRDLYTSQNAFIVESGKFIEMGEEPAAVRRHTRFVDFPAHRHDYVEIFYVLTGSVTHIIEGENITVHAGELLLMNQHIEHAVAACGEKDLAMNIILRPEYFRKVAELLEADNALTSFLKETLEEEKSLGKFFYFRVSENICIQNLVRNLIWLIMNRPRGWYELSQHTTALLLRHLVANAEHMLLDGEDEKINMLMAVVRQYITDRLDTGTLTELSDRVGYTPSSLSRLIRKYSGSTFKELQAKQRLQTAMNLLETTEMPVLEIAGTVGYENLNFFYKRFKNEYGILPGDVRGRR